MAAVTLHGDFEPLVRTHRVETHSLKLVCKTDVFQNLCCFHVSADGMNVMERHVGSADFVACLISDSLLDPR